MGEFKLKRQYGGYPHVIGKPFGESINFGGENTKVHIRAEKNIPAYDKDVRGATPEEIKKAVLLNDGYAMLFDYVETKDNVTKRTDAVKWAAEEKVRSKQEAAPATRSFTGGAGKNFGKSEKNNEK